MFYSFISSSGVLPTRLPASKWINICKSNEFTRLFAVRKYMRPSAAPSIVFNTQCIFWLRIKIDWLDMSRTIKLRTKTMSGLPNKIFITMKFLVFQFNYEGRCAYYVIIRFINYTSEWVIQSYHTQWIMLFSVVVPDSIFPLSTCHRWCHAPIPV